MAEKNKEPKRPRALAPIGDYAVGYCKPPKATQFQKGQPSANPKGRPPKAKPLSPLQQGWTNGFHKMTLEEAMRPVQVRDGNKVVQITTWQAAVRATHLKAAAGHAQSMRNAIAVMQQAQSALRNEKEELIAHAIGYKQELTAYARHCDENDIDHGLPIHPDDIDFDILEGEVLIKGPLTPDERALLKIFNDGVRVAKIYLIEACEELKATPRKTVTRKRIMDLTELIHRCNEVLPERYQVDPYAIVSQQGVEL